jgi:hypothetical protein
MIKIKKLHTNVAKKNRMIKIKKLHTNVAVVLTPHLL